MAPFFSDVFHINAQSYAICFILLLGLSQSCYENYKNVLAEASKNTTRSGVWAAG